VLDRARLFADDGIVRPEHLPELLHGGMARAAMAPASVRPAVRGGEIGDADLRRLAEGQRCTRKELARQAGLSERTLYRRLKVLGLA